MSKKNVRPLFKKWFNTFLSFSALGLVHVGVHAVPSVTDYQAVPPVLEDVSIPLVMLAMSKDHQLFYKAFTDYDDINGDGVIDTTYVNDIKYVGYFDSKKCYVYDATNKYYEPVSLMDNALTTAVVENYCNQGSDNEWSGNFLNWASMSRMDQIRKVLYGGYRSSDPSDASHATILERSHLPPDAHSFAKYYNGDDLTKLTPFPANTVSETVKEKLGITICNTTPLWNNAFTNSSTITSPPVIRVAKGNFSLWATNERWQCLWHEEQETSDVDDAVEGKNANDSSKTKIYAYGTSPQVPSDLVQQRDGVTRGSYYARVQVCKAGLIGDEDCKTYPSGNVKPVGILQNFGDDGKVEFGMMTGSYKKNKSGGVLRKNIGDLSTEVNVSTYGTFTNASGIINTLNKFRIANYDYVKGRYNDTDSCAWGISSFTDGECVNWGNPFSEIMLECYRYFAGKSPNANFDADDSTIISGLSRETTWTDPLSATNNCAKLNVIAFNASTSSFDADSLTGISDLRVSVRADGKNTAKLITDLVGDGEGISGGSFFVGATDTTTAPTCTPKTVNNLGSVLGTCPDAPGLKGSYQLAGLAYHANTFDLRPLLAEDQTVKTYGVTLSPGVPNIQIKVPGLDHTVKILPACRAKMYDNVYTNCGLVDFKIVKNYEETSVGSGVFKGSFYVNWEDTEQGGDYDMDLYGMIHYTIDSSGIKVETEVIHQSTDKPMGFGFIISGTTTDGIHVKSGHSPSSRDWWGNITVKKYSEFDCQSRSGGYCAISNGLQSKTFSFDTASGSSLLQQPLYYAAKWGGFSDEVVEGEESLLPKPDAARPNEWDKKINATGKYGSDGIPDTYFEATNPDQLKAQIEQILRSILERTASGTSAAVVTNSGSGEGALYQALYNPKFSAKTGLESVKWVGTLNALFLDRYGNLRADDDAKPGQLTDDDSIVDVFYDQNDKVTLVQFYDLALDGSRGAKRGAPVELSEINPIWSAGDMLGTLTNLTDQRPYTREFSNAADSGRYIFTGIDGVVSGTTRDGVVDNDEVVPFTAAQFAQSVGNAELYRLLGLKSADSAKAEKIVNYVRGKDDPSMRSRRINIDDDPELEALLLGDITHSSPHAVARPSEGYDINFGDGSYRTFRDQYYGRRQVVYIGANDGMLHAFNGGFFDAATSTYKLKPDQTSPSTPVVDTSVAGFVTTTTTNTTTQVTADGTNVITEVVVEVEDLSDGSVVRTPATPTNVFTAGNTGGQQPLGAELWAYVPYNLLPHLQWLTDIDYPHVYYVDGAIKHYDVNIFPADADHPGGWGTILVVGMRFGGGEYTLDPEEDNELDDPTENITLRSSYIILDVTNPEVPPKLWAEVTHPSLGYTTAEPTLIKYRESDANGSYSTTGAVNEWRLVFGSGPAGPEALSDGVSNQNAVLFTYDLKDKRLDTWATGEANSFVGGVESADWYRDYKDDALYYGTVSGTVAAPSGKLKRATLAYASGTITPTSADFINPAQPFFATPLTMRDRQNNFWIYAGTGRFLVSADNGSTGVQSFYGLKDPVTAGGILAGTTLTESDLVNTTGISVFTDGSIEKPTPVVEPKLALASTFNGVYNKVKTEDGWYFDLERLRSRNFTKSVVADQSLVFTQFQPSGLKCEPEGRGYLSAVHHQAGIPGLYKALGSTNHDNDGTTPERIDDSVDLGVGSPSAPSIHEDGQGDQNAVVQNSTGALTSTQIQRGIQKGSRQSWRELNITW